MFIAGKACSCATPSLGSDLSTGTWTWSEVAHRLQSLPNSLQCRKELAALGALSTKDEHFGIRKHSPQQTENSTRRSSLAGRKIAFTTPLQYATRLAKFLEERGAELLWCPTVVTEQTAETRLEVERILADPAFCAHGVAFTSREGIRAFSSALNGGNLSVLQKHWRGKTTKTDVKFIVGALGTDAELLRELSLISVDDVDVNVIVPAVSTPQALVEALGDGLGRTLLCPVPFVDGLEEPPVVPQFLERLRGRGWIPIRVNSYVTRWLGEECAGPLLVHEKLEDPASRNVLDIVAMEALIFTSTAEVEGLLKSLTAMGLVGLLQDPRREFLVAAHGPVTALGAERLGVQVDVVGQNFRSFAGVIDAIEAKFCECSSDCSETPFV